MLCDGVMSLKGRYITYKTSRNTRITRLDEAHVPLNKAMELTRHRDQKSFKKYCKAHVEVIDCVMQRCLARDSVDGTYCSVLDEEKQHLDQHKVYLLYFCKFVYSFLVLFV